VAPPPGRRRLPNPLNSEAEAFQTLILFVLVLAVIVGIVLAIKALS